MNNKKNVIKKKIVRLTEKDIEKLVNHIVKENFNWDSVLGNDNKWYELEKDLNQCLEPIIEKYSQDFGSKDVSLQDHKSYGGWVFIHRNLHKPPYWSIKKGKNTGPVIGYDTDIWLTDVIFKVSESGKERVRKEKQKNVHAGVVGKIKETGGNYNTSGWTLITYNPYKHDTFVEYETGNPIYRANEAILKNTKEVWVR